jgi:hypothetical protein
MLSIRFLKVLERDCPSQRLFTCFVGTRTLTRPVVRTDSYVLVGCNRQLSDVYLQIRVRNSSFAAAVILPQAQPETGSVIPLQAVCFPMRIGARCLRCSDRTGEEGESDRDGDSNDSNDEVGPH